MRLLVLGGTFNPIHVGHLMLAEEVAAEFDYDRVLLVPSFIPPHKAAESDPGPEARLAMARAAVSGDERFIVDGCEITRGGTSYTIDTLDYVAGAFRLEGKPGLVIGDDLAPGFSSWRDPDGICQRAALIVARRGLSPRPAAAALLTYPHRVAHNMLLPISSTDIRERIASGRPWRSLVPRPAADIIAESGLYRRDGACPVRS
jgi:nicotinate-nucleotide adenylyltransferase